MRSLSSVAASVLLLSVSLFVLLSPVVGQSATAGASPAAVATINDGVVLNFALTLERLDSTFFSCYLYPLNTTNPACAYTNASYAFSAADFAAAGYNASVYAAVQLIAMEELAHASIINSTIMALGYQPVPTCQYVYPGITSVAAYLAQGLAFETVGTAAYAGGLNGISNPSFVQATAAIATVEARHAAYLSQLQGVQPFASSGFNPVYNGSQVAALIAPYYVNPACLAQTVLPKVRPYGVTGENATNPAPYIGSQVASSGFTYSAQAQANDVKTLNYALILEELEATFYGMAGAAFTAAQFAAAGYNASVPAFLAIIAANENTHVSVLQATIAAYGGVPVQNCSYNFSALGFNAFSSIPNYLAYASTLESTGVQAYDGAANSLTDTYLLQVAGTIALIEARHTAFINAILSPNNQSTAFPSAVDPTMTPLQVLNLVVSLGIVTSCPGFNVSNPAQVAALLPQIVTPFPVNTTAAAGGSSSSSTGVATAPTFANYSSSSGAVSPTTIPNPTPTSAASSGVPAFNNSASSVGPTMLISIGAAALALLAL